MSNKNENPYMQHLSARHSSAQNRSKKTAWIISSIILVIALIAIYMAWQFSKSEVQRGQLNWQNRMSVVLSGREQAIENWLDKQVSILENLNHEPRFQIYFSSALDALNSKGDQTSEQEAHINYLAIQLKQIAAENGFSDQSQAHLKIKANVKREKTAGIALTDALGNIIIATPNMPTISAALSGFMNGKSKNLKNKTLIYGPYLSSPQDGQNSAPKNLVIAFIAPIYAVQDDEAQEILGFTIAVKKLAARFFDHLTQPGEVALSAQNYLFRSNGKLIEYLSPLKDKAGLPLEPLYSLNADMPKLAAYFALKNPRSFATKLNYKGEEVLVMGRKISNTDWMILRTITTTEALGPLKTRGNNIMLFSLFSILLTALLLIVLWRHGASVKLSDALEEQQSLLSKFMEISHFLRIVSDSQPTSITALDKNGHYRFANHQASLNMGQTEEQMMGKSLRTVLENSNDSVKTSGTQANIRRLSSHYREAIETGENSTEIHSFIKKGEKVTLKTDYIPFSLTVSNIDSEKAGDSEKADDSENKSDSQKISDSEKGVLIVEENISPLMIERERREMALKTLVKTLAMIIDARDPYSSSHSARVAEVAKVIAQQMALSDIAIDTAEISGALMNLGKIFVPIELLTREDSLSEAELNSIRENLYKTADLLKGVKFEGPVVDTIRQSHAHYDGTGFPHGLSGEDILLSARIVSVANVFVSMVSARAYRPGLDLKEAAELIHQKSGTIFDPKPVITLMNYIENQDGYDEWRRFSVPAQKPAS